MIRIDGAEARRIGDAIIREELLAQANVVREETRALEQDLEKITRLSVPGKLWRAWKSEAYPKSGAARNPVGTVFVSGGKRSLGAIDYFTKEGRNRNKDGFFLAVPTPAAGPRGRNRDLTPGAWEKRTGLRLRFVYRPNRASLLVLDEGVLSGKGQVGRLNSPRRRASGRGNATVIIFILIPYQNFRPSFAIGPVVDQGIRRFVNRAQQAIAAGARGI